MNTAASEAEKLGNIQQKVGASQVRRRSLEAFSRSRFSANETQVRRSQEVFSQYSAESRRRSEALTGAPLEEDEILQNSTACVDGRAAVQEKGTAHVKHLAHGAKRHEAQLSHSGARGPVTTATP